MVHHMRNIAHIVSLPTRSLLLRNQLWDWSHLRCLHLRQTRVYILANTSTTPLMVYKRAKRLSSSLLIELEHREVRCCAPVADASLQLDRCPHPPAHQLPRAGTPPPALPLLDYTFSLRT